METMLYRVLNKGEVYNFHYTSYVFQSKWKENAIEFYEQIEMICKLSQKCNIKIASALRIASQYGWVIEDIKHMIQNNATEVPLHLFLVDNEKKDSIPMQPLVEFINEYNTFYEDTGIFLDEDKGDGQYFWEIIWDIVRRDEFPDANSRLDCCFAFTNKTDAVQFSKEFREIEDESNVAEVIIEDADTSVYDMQWITTVPTDATMNEAIEYARNYWKGLKTKSPIMEVLIYGEYIFKKHTDD